jgi:hypothetical protein
VVPFLYGGNFVGQVAINPGRYKEIERTRHQGSSGPCLVMEKKRCRVAKVTREWSFELDTLVIRVGLKTEPVLVSAYMWSPLKPATRNNLLAWKEFFLDCCRQMYICAKELVQFKNIRA